MKIYTYTNNKHSFNLECSLHKKELKLTKWLLKPIIIVTIMALLVLNNPAFASMGEAMKQNSVKINNNEPTNGLSQSTWLDVKRQINLSKYYAHELDNGSFLARNIAHKWSIDFDKNGQTRLTSLSGKDNYKIGLKLKSIGYKNKTSFNNPKDIVTENNKLIYQWNENIQEVWINSPQSLEQWFEIQHKPVGANNETNDGTNKQQPLEIVMQLDSTLAVVQNGQALNFANKISYNKLKVWDSQNTIIPATMQLQGKQLSLIIDDSKAIYPLTVDPSFQQQAYLKAFNAGIDDLFGFSVAISEDYMVVGVIDEGSGNGNPFSDNAPNAGAAFVFERDNSGQWNLLGTYLKPSNIGAGDRFGWSVAISGNTIVIGAPNEDSNATGVNNDGSDNSKGGSGAAYVFTRNNGTWTQEAYIKASNTDGGPVLGDAFGSAVAVSGNIIVVGAPAEDSNALGVDGNESNNGLSASGAAYVFEKIGNTWSQQAYLKASNTGASDLFGTAVAISGGTVIVGASGEDSNSTGVDGDGTNNSANNSGAAYVFTNINTFGGVWVQQAYLKASNTGFDDRFGSSVAISGGMLVVGAFGEDSTSFGINGNESNNSANSSGAAYVFRQSIATSSWFQTAYIKASNTQAGDQFGISVALSGSLLVVGANAEDSSAAGIDGDENNNSSGASGATYVFRLNTSNIWSQISYLKSFNSEADDNFGRAVAISGDSIVVGATGEDGNGSAVDNNNTSNSGAAYVFTATDSIWDQQRITKASNIDAGDRFGNAIAMTETTLVVGAFLEDSATGSDESDNNSTDSGAVYVFTRGSSGRWEQQAYLKAAFAGINDWFGYSVAISGDTIVVGARNERSNATGVNGDASNNSLFQAGAAYVFTRDNDIWTQQAYVKPSNPGASDFFGFSVAVSGDTMVVGAVWEDSDAIGIDGDDGNDLAAKSGAAYVFVRDGQGTWNQQSYLKASNTDADDEFGRAVSIAGDTLIVGANREDSDGSGVGAANNNNGDNTGAVYVFARDNGLWQQEAYVKAQNPGNSDEFGRSIALSATGFTFVIGARNEDSNSPFSPDNNSSLNSGAVYGFRKNLGAWAPFGYIKAPNLNNGDWFGDWVAISGDDTIVVGASRENSQSKNNNSGENDNSLPNAGAAYIFTSNIVGEWSLQTYLKASNSGAEDIFGSAVAIAEYTVVVGASLEDSSTGSFDNDSAVDSGAIYIYNTSDVIFEDGFE